MTSLPSGPRCGPDTKVDEVFPVKRCVQQGDRNAEIQERLIGFSLRIKVRHLVTRLQRGHLITIEGDEVANILKCRPDSMLNSRRCRSAGQIPTLRRLLLCREVLPEVGDAIRTVSAVEGALQALYIIQVSLNHVDAALCQGDRLLRFRPAGYRSRLE